MRIGHTLRRNCLLHDAIEGSKKSRKKNKLLDDLRKRRRYWDQKEEAEDQNRWKRQFINRI